MYFYGKDAGVSSDALGRTTTEYVAGTGPIMAAGRFLVIGIGYFVLDSLQLGIDIEFDMAGLPRHPVSDDCVARSRRSLDVELLEFTPHTTTTL
jgi:hypothetical protein